MPKEKLKPEVTMSHYVVLAVFTFIVYAALRSDRAEFHKDPFGLVLESGIVAAVFPALLLQLLSGMGFVKTRNTNAE